MRKRVLLTGIGGSIGVHFWCGIMHRTDWEVVGIDSFRHMGRSSRIVEAAKAHPEWMPRTTILTHDLCAPIDPVLGRQIGNIDHVINMASLSDVHASIVDPAPFIRNNVQVVLTMLEWARAEWASGKPLQSFVQISSDEVYGPTDGISQHKEWDPILPSSAYSASKAAQEAICIGYWRSYGLPLIITNFMNNFGEMQNPNKFPVIVQRKVAAGEPVTIHGSRETAGSRYYIHSRNAADAVLFLLERTIPHLHVDGWMDKPDRYNIVGDRQVSNVELAELIAAMMGKPLQMQLEDFSVARPGHDRHYGLDGSKLAALGWRAPRSFEDSLAEVVWWQQEHPEWLAS